MTDTDKIFVVPSNEEEGFILKLGTLNIEDYKYIYIHWWKIEMQHQGVGLDTRNLKNVFTHLKHKVCSNFALGG